jgi:ATP phosphoribosyltransferase regulatory subunit
MLDELARILSAVPSDRIRIDFSVTGDLGYYNGIVFKGFIKGIPQSILSGGQYDNLMRRMGRKSRAIGFALYLDLLEELEYTPRDYDVDTVLLYENTVPLAYLTKTVRELTRNGEISVQALRAVPEKLRYKTLLKLTEKGVETIETNA